MNDQKEKKPIRVRFYPTDTDEVFEGSVIEETKFYFLVVPDQNLALKQRWAKSRCNVISFSA